jgi:predicted nucleotidyltransferase
MPEAATDDDANLARLISRIADALSPDAIYLFGSRAIYLFGSRALGDPRADSDYDVLVVVPDDTPAERLRPEDTYQLARDVRIAADIVTCRKSGFDRWRDEVGTLSYEAAHFGKLVYGR